MKPQSGINIFRTAFLFLAFVFLNLSFTSAQEKLDFRFEKEAVKVEKGSTFTNILVIGNSGSSAIIIQQINPQDSYPGLLLYPKAEFSLGPGESRRFPVKFIANLEFMKLRTDEIRFNVSYVTSTSAGTESAAFSVIKDENRNIAIYTESYENFINPAAPTSSIRLTVENQGYSKRTVKIDLQSIPDGLEVIPGQQTITLEGQEKQMVDIRIAVRKQNTVFPEFSISATATDLSDNEIVGSNTVHLVILSNNRQVSQLNQAVKGSNFAEVGYNENSSGFNYLQLRGNAGLAVARDTRARLNLGADYFLEENRYNLYDTWLEVERKKTVLRLGNVSGTDYDYAVFGRGAEISTAFGDKSQIEILAVENNFNLYGNYFQRTEGSRMAGAKYSFGNGKSHSGKVSYVFDHDPRSGVETQVANAVTSVLINDNHTFRAEAGLSHEKGLSNGDENSGASMGFNYGGRLGKWDLQSDNSFATKSYAGLKRGSFFLNQRIGYRFTDSQRAFIQYQNSQVEPEFLSFQNGPVPVGAAANVRYYFNSTEAFTGGYQFSSKDWNFMVAPKVDRQKTANYYSAHELFSYRLETNIGTTLGAHGINWTAEYSYSKENGNPEWFSSLKTALSYRYRSFSLNGSAQWNANNVFDLNSFYDTDRNFANYNVYASYHIQMLNSNLTGSVSAGTSYSELYKNLNSNITGNLEYKISPSWSSTGYFNFSGYQSDATFGSSGSFYQFRVGIKKYFTAATAPGNHKVTLQLFEDKNFNGVPEPGEVMLANEIVKLNSFVAMTDKNGKVVFRNVPHGTYALMVNQSAGSRLMMDPVIAVNSNMNLKVGLVKNIRVTGKLTEIRQAYDELETDVTGIVVYAKEEDGTVHSAVVNQNSEFEFFLKDGKYEIYIENDKYIYTQPRQIIQVTREGYAGTVLFEYKKKDTTVKVKKF